MIAGLEEPTTGTVAARPASDVTDLPPYKRPVNTVFQNYALFPHLDIYENVAFGLRRRGIKSVKKQVEEMLDLVQLGAMARRKPQQLSGGQQQRVAVARALINHPQVLLLDEPLGALDLKLRRQMQLELKRIQTEVGITFVHVTHDQEEAMTMADTVAVMNGGRVEQLGAPADLYENPAHHLRRQLPGHLQPHRGRGRRGRAATDICSSRPADAKLRLPAGRCSATARTGEKVLAGVRPEKISLTHADDAGSRRRRPQPAARPHHATPASSASPRSTSSRRRAWRELAVYEQNIERDGRLVPGAEVVLHWNPAHTFGLDAAQDIQAGADLDEEAA